MFHKIIIVAKLSPVRKNVTQRRNTEKIAKNMAHIFTKYPHFLLIAGFFFCEKSSDIAKHIKPAIMEKKVI